MIKLVISWTCVGVFIATAIITLLALVKVIRLANDKYLDWLVRTFVLEVVATCIAIFTGFMEAPSTVERRIEERGIEAGHEIAKDAFEKRLQEIRPVLERYVREDRSLSTAEKEKRLELARKPTAMRLDPSAVRRALGR